MAKNPMQRKAQNSFLLGMLITLLITGIIIAVLILQITKLTKKQKELEANKVDVCVLTMDVKSGQVITEDMVKTMKVDKTTIPSNSFGNDASKISTYQLQDMYGNAIKTDTNGNPCAVYIDKTTGEVVKDKNTGEPEYRVIETTDEINYYYQDTKEEIKLTKVPIIAKVDINANTVLTSSLIVQSDEKVTDDIRRVEYNMVSLPSQIETGEYIDIRLKLPDGTDFIVVSHKQLTIPEVDGFPSLTTIALDMSETEILTMSCAIVEAYKIEGSILYVSQYIEPGLQSAATETYIPNDATVTLIRRDPNCVTAAANAIITRYNDSNKKNSVRNPINNGLNDNEDSALDNAVSNMDEEVQRAQEERQKYLESLGGSY